MDEKKTRISKNLLEKRKGGLKNLRSMRRPPGWDRSLPEERKRNDKDLQKTEKERRKLLNINILYIYIIMYLNDYIPFTQHKLEQHSMLKKRAVRKSKETRS